MANMGGPMVSSCAGDPLRTLGSFGLPSSPNPEGLQKYNLRGLVRQPTQLAHRLHRCGRPEAALHVGFLLPIMCKVSLHPSNFPAPKAICPFRRGRRLHRERGRTASFLRPRCSWALLSPRARPSTQSARPYPDPRPHAPVPPPISGAQPAP